MYKTLPNKINLGSYSKLILFFIGISILVFIFSPEKYRLKPLCFWGKAEACILLGVIYFTPSEYDVEKAKFYFLRANNLKENDPTVLYHLGRIAFIQGDLNSSKLYLTQTLMLNESFLQARYMGVF